MSKQKHEEAGRAFAALAYILPVVGGVIGMLADGRNPLTRSHALQSIAAVITLILSFLVWIAVGYVVALVPTLGPIISISLFSLVIAMAVFLAVNWIVSLVVALRGEERTIPIANRIALRLFGSASAETRNV
jgi:uncharacterized membrane protein